MSRALWFFAGAAAVLVGQVLGLLVLWVWFRHFRED